MRTTLTILLSLITATLMAQSLQSPVFSGTNSSLAWDSSVDATGYNVYLLTGTGVSSKVATTTNTAIKLSLILPPSNGVYGLYVTAFNLAGESIPSTNIYTKYFANKPNPPGNPHINP